MLLPSWSTPSNDRARADRARDRAEEVERLQAAVITGLEAKLEDLRHQLVGARAAELSAREEAGRLRTRFEALQTRGWWARLRNK
jgi:hypothetical protein